MTNRTGFTSTSRATTWDEGLMVGTGSTGATLFAGDAHHLVSLGHERFFVPVEPVIPPPPVAASLPALRTRLAKGPLDSTAAMDAEELMREAWAEVGHDGRMLSPDPLLPVGLLRLIPERSTGVRDYRRTADWADATGTVAWRDDQGRHAVTVKAHRDTDRVTVLVPSAFTGTIRLDPPQPPIPGRELRAPARDRSSLVRSVQSVEGNALAVVTESTAAHAEGLPRATVTARVHAPGAAVTAVGDEVRVVGATEVTIELTVLVETGADGSDARRDPRGDHAELFHRSTLDLRSGDERDVEAVRADPAGAVALTELAYAAGRCAVISATGALPPTLQGVWAGSLAPAWGSDFTLNGNVQNGSCAAMWSTGTPELLGALFDLVDAYRPDLATNARALFDAPGVLVPAHMTTHGFANHFSADYPHQYWIGGAGWILRFAWDQAVACGDEEFLLRRVWPFAQDTMAFYEDVLALGPDGCLHAAPSYSPENTPDGHSSAVTVDATSEIMMISDAASLAARIALLAGDVDAATRWTTWAEDLPPLRVAPDGQLAEWLDPAYPDQIAHRHASHLYAFWYGQSESFPVRLEEAARRTVQARVDWRAADPTPPPGRMEMAFGLVQLGLAAAAVGDAEAALQCTEWLARDHFRANMMPTHDAGVLFNVDAAGGLPALVAAMLVGGDESALAVTPALPDAWPSGRATGLRARGGLVIERLEWTAESVEVDLTAVPGSAWARPRHGNLIRLPWVPSQATVDGVPLDPSRMTFVPEPGRVQRFHFRR